MTLLTKGGYYSTTSLLSFEFKSMVQSECWRVIQESHMLDKYVDSEFGTKSMSMSMKLNYNIQGENFGASL